MVAARRVRYHQAMSLAALLVVLVALASAGCGAPVRPEQQAAMLADKGRSEDAIELLRAHLAKHPDDLPARRQLVRVLALTGKLDEVERAVAELAERAGPGDPSPLIELGHAFELSHRYEEALVAYDRAADAAPKDPRGPRTGGLRAARWGAPELAEPRLVEALRRDATDARTWHALGLVRVQLGDLSAARTAYSRGLVANPSAIENRVGLATVALVEGDAAAALVEYDALAAARPRLGDVQLGRALCLLKLGRLTEAEQAIARAESLGASRRVVARQRALLGRLRMASEEQKNR